VNHIIAKLIFKHKKYVSIYYVFIVFHTKLNVVFQNQKSIKKCVEYTQYKKYIRIKLLIPTQFISCLIVVLLFYLHYPFAHIYIH